VPGQAWWLLDGHQHGHTHAEALWYGSALLDEQDQQRRSGSDHVVVVSPEVGRRPRRGLLGWLLGR
jgi:hypothetical protein